MIAIVIITVIINGLVILDGRRRKTLRERSIQRAHGRLTRIGVMPIGHRRDACADANRRSFIVSKRPQAVTDAELAVLKVLWQNGPQTARGLTEAIYPGGAESEFASVHSFLRCLERKGLVRRRTSSPRPYPRPSWLAAS